MQRIFNGRSEVRYAWARYGWTRGGGKTWHGGLDIVGLDDTTIRMPAYTAADGTVTELTGTVTRARIVTDHNNKTWEWGYYICIRLDKAVGGVRYLYFCHCASLLVKQGAKVKTGDALAIMGNTGNAAQADPPYKHCHFEVRAASGGKGLDPTPFCGCSNAVGIYGETKKEAETVSETSMQGLLIGPMSAEQAAPFDDLAAKQALDGTHWAKLAAGGGEVLRAACVSSGDAWQHYTLAKAKGVQYKSVYA